MKNQDKTREQLIEELAALRREQKAYRPLIDDTGIMVSMYDEDGVCLFMNKTVARLFGGQPDDFTGKSFHELHPEKGKAYTDRIREVIQSGTRVIYDDLVVFLTGERWLLSTVEPVRDESGRIVAAQVLSQDITERRQTENALNESEMRYRTLFNTSTDAIFLETLSGQVLDCNDAACNMFGYTKRELMKLTVADLVPHEIAVQLPKIIAEEIQTGGTSIQSLGKRKDGEIFPTGVSTQLVEFEGESYIVVYVRDITERKNAKATIWEGRKRLEKLNIRLEEKNRELQTHQDHLEELVTERTRQLAVAATLGEQLNAILDLDKLLVELVNQIKTSFGYYHAHIYLLDEMTNGLVVAAGTGKAGAQMNEQKHQIPLNAVSSLVAQAARSGEIVWVDNVREKENWLPNSLLPETRSEMAVPIIREGEVVGVLDVQENKIAGLDEGDANLLRSLAGHVAVALTNARLFQKNRTALKETEILYTISQRLIAADNLSDLLATVAEEIALPAINRAVLGVFDYDRAGDVESTTVRANWYSGTGTEPSPIGTTYPRETLDDAPFFTERPLFFNNSPQGTNDDSFALEITQRLNIHALIVLPLWSQGRQIGVLLLQGEAPYEFSDREIRLYSSVLGQLASAVEIHLVLNQLEERVFECTQELSAANLTLHKRIIEHERTEEALLDSNRQFEAALSQMVAMQEQMLQQERMAAVGQLAAGIAHDFNNILTGILGFAELLLLQQEIPASAQRKVEHIATQGQRAAHLVRQILDFSRKSVPRPQRIDLAAALEKMVELLERTIPENIHILLGIEPGAYPVDVDPTQLQQVVTNLAVNARDAMPLGGHLKLRLFPFTLKYNVKPPCLKMLPGEWIALSVSDSGVGIPAKLLPHIFEPFFTSKGVGEGTGLGLAQVYGIVRQHKGYVAVESREGEGSTFTIYLPAQPEEGVFLESERSGEAYRGHGETILLVDDEHTVLEVGQAVLMHLGYRVLTAISGQEALAVFAGHKEEISLVLTDLVMPGMSGDVLVGQLRSRNPDLKVILMTGYPLQDGSRQMLALGATNWLKKPLKITQLAQALSEALKK